MNMVKLYYLFSKKDASTTELFCFQVLNTWWLFMLWSPSTALSTDNFLRWIFSALAIILLVVGILALVTKDNKLRLTVLFVYVIFYLFTGLCLLFKSPIDPLGGFFICQGLSAMLLIWRLQTRFGNVIWNKI